jgi:hypothetical protein
VDGGDERIDLPEVVADEIERVAEVEVVAAVGHDAPLALDVSIGMAIGLSLLIMAR